MTRPERRRGHPPPPLAPRTPLRLLLRVASVACGVQFGWALQLSLLTPYVQELGIPHQWASLIWLCGPVSGLVVQPLVGHMSDRSSNPYGRRRPFIAAGVAGIAVAVMLVGFSADIGGFLGDKGDGSRPRAIAVFVLGFWVLDVGNNATQGPCRALLADLTVKDLRRTRVANAYFSLFMALGNILGFAAGSYSGWYSILPFTITSHCGMDCANLKSAFLLHILILTLTTYISLTSTKETPLNSANGILLDATENHQVRGSETETFLWELLGAVRYLSWPIWIVLILTALTWTAWFPFLLFDTDWMGREIYHGEPNAGGSSYHSGVRMGAFGLMLNSIVLGFTSIGVEKLCRKWGSGLFWGVSNLLMAICFVAMLIASYVAKNIKYHPGHPPAGIVIAALVAFTALGVPLAVTYSVPYAMISTRSESLGIGQGLAMGILNLAVVIPQIIVSMGSGPWDQLFGGGNSPAFAVAAVASFISGIVAILAIPRSPVSVVRIPH